MCWHCSGKILDHASQHLPIHGQAGYSLSSQEASSFSHSTICEERIEVPNCDSRSVEEAMIERNWGGGGGGGGGEREAEFGVVRESVWAGFNNFLSAAAVWRAQGKAIAVIRVDLFGQCSMPSSNGFSPPCRHE